MKDNLTEATLNDNSFANITFDDFYGYRIKRISNKAFGKSNKTIKQFWCASCELSETPLEYNVWTTLNQLTEVNHLTVGLNVTKIPSNAFKPNNGAESKLKSLALNPKQNLTIKSNAFSNLNRLDVLEISENSLKYKNEYKFEKSAFNFSGIRYLHMEFTVLNLTGDYFAPGSFDGNKQSLDISLMGSNITYIPESSFKSVLNNNGNKVKFYLSYIDCTDCRNMWLITNQKDKQVINALCKSDTKKTLFDEDIQVKLKNKCK